MMLVSAFALILWQLLIATRTGAQYDYYFEGETRRKPYSLFVYQHVTCLYILRCYLKLHVHLHEAMHTTHHGATPKAMYLKLQIQL